MGYKNIKEELEQLKCDIKAATIEAVSSEDLSKIQYFTALLKITGDIEENLMKLKSKVDTGIDRKIIAKNPNSLLSNFLDTSGTSCLKSFEGKICREPESSDSENNQSEDDESEESDECSSINKKLYPAPKEMANVGVDNVFMLRLNKTSYAKCEVIIGNNNKLRYKLLKNSRALKDHEAGKFEIEKHSWEIESDREYSSIEELSNTLVNESCPSWGNFWINRKGINLVHWLYLNNFSSN